MLARACLYRVCPLWWDATPWCRCLLLAACRLGWTGDSAITNEESSFNFDTSAIYNFWVAQIADGSTNTRDSNYPGEDKSASGLGSARTSRAFCDTVAVELVACLQARRVLFPSHCQVSHSAGASCAGSRGATAGELSRPAAVLACRRHWQVGARPVVANGVAHECAHHVQVRYRTLRQQHLLLAAVANRVLLPSVHCAGSTAI